MYVEKHMIHLQDVSVTYPGGITAVHPVNLDFQAGEFCVILGLSGAGKSSLIRCLNFLNEPTTGKVVVEGIGELNSKERLLAHRRQTGIIFQQHQLIAHQPTLQNTLVGRLGYHSTWRSLLPFPQSDVQICLEALDRVGLLEKALERVDNLSGGQQQRVGIARALAQKPRILLADEPVASLDPATSGKVLHLIHGICKEYGLCSVVSLHQVELAMEFADRIVGLDAGKVVFDGRPGDLSQDELARIYGKKTPGELGRSREDVPMAPVSENFAEVPIRSLV